ncbi:MAG: hypothetical protein K2X29_09315 [Candidatus Obscuribacterales bacterium]|nr:hypothetical protein [Candidatus Obscuribacterales bacterium]
MKTSQIILLNLSFVMSISSSLALTPKADWGYDSTAKPQTAPETKNKRQVHTGFAVQSNRVTSMLPTSAPVEKEKDRHTQAIESWLELYQLVSLDHELTEPQQKLIQQSLYAKLMAGQSAEVLGILEFWPTVKRVCQLLPAQQDNYKDLFKSLMRLQLRSAHADESNLSQTAIGELEAMAQLLGPERVAVQGEPPLTDSAIQAYADMACFIFEQNHPGRTVDAEDNRTMFANVICDKYRNAPDGPAREAMLNFDLTWAKFKILWTKGTEADHQQMLAQWNTGAKPVTTIPAVKRPPVSDQTLATVLNNGPWKKILLARIAKPAVN